MVDVQADGIGETLPGEAVLLAQFDQLDREVHRKQSLNDRAHTLPHCSPKLSMLARNITTVNGFELEEYCR